MTINAPVVRLAGLADVEDLIRLNAALFQTDAKPRDPIANLDWPWQHGVERFRTWLGDPSRRLLIAAVEGSPAAGYLSGRIETSEYQVAHVAVIGSMFVDEAYRSYGLGGRMVDEFFEWARRQDVRVAEVTAYAANSDAQRFYGRNGFSDGTVTLRAMLDDSKSGPPPS